MTSRTHQIYNIVFEHGFDPPSPVWTMFKKTALFLRLGFPKTDALPIRQSNPNPRQSMSIHTDVSQITEGTSTVRTGYWDYVYWDDCPTLSHVSAIRRFSVKRMSIRCQPDVGRVSVLPILCQSIPIRCQYIANSMPNNPVQSYANSVPIYWSKSNPCQLTLNRTNKSVTHN